MTDTIIDNVNEAVVGVSISESFFLLHNVHIYMATRETAKPLLLSAVLGSKDEVAMMRLCSD